MTRSMKKALVTTKVMVLSLLAVQSIAAAKSPGQLVKIQNDKETYIVRYTDVFPEGRDWFAQRRYWAMYGNTQAVRDQAMNELTNASFLIARQYPDTSVTICGDAVASDLHDTFASIRQHKYLPGGHWYLYLLNGQVHLQAHLPQHYDGKPGAATQTLLPAPQIAPPIQQQSRPILNIPLRDGMLTDPQV